MGENRFIIEKEEPVKVSMKNAFSMGLVVDTMRVITDMKTGVEYLVFSNGPRSGLTLLVDREGKPLINENYR